MEALLPKTVTLSGGSPGSKEMQQLLLGLQLINKSLKKPAKPQPLQPNKEGEASSSESESSPSPPALMENLRKRKLPSDFNEPEKREKR